MTLVEQPRDAPAHRRPRLRARPRARGHRRVPSAAWARARLHGHHRRPADAGRRGPVSSGRIRDAIATGAASPRRSRCSAAPTSWRASSSAARDAAPASACPPPTSGSTPSRCIPAAGVYAGWLNFGDGWRPAATGIGTRPTFGGGSVTVEAHVLDFDGDLYGRSGAAGARPADSRPSARSHRSTALRRRWPATSRAPARSCGVSTPPV